MIYIYTLKEVIFARVDFRVIFFGHFAGINFRELGLTKDFWEIDIRESTIFKVFAGVNLTFALRNIFSTTLFYGFENNLSKNLYFININRWQYSRWSQEGLIQKTLY